MFSFSTPPAGAFGGAAGAAAAVVLDREHDLLVVGGEEYPNVAGDPWERVLQCVGDKLVDGDADRPCGLDVDGTAVRLAGKRADEIGRPVGSVN